ncbi:hypothetical protein F2P81_008262 [Scophthalmus maximus]|uniref:Uncharacterized protein n=1 Tax=Scophthalmus maximus TaxID=52904 RepID=A0A6A4T1T3_SCOMX|nr:hypothetical protein F2P81_008262 [Scophthalmus maximus]
MRLPAQLGCCRGRALVARRRCTSSQQNIWHRVISDEWLLLQQIGTNRRTGQISHTATVTMYEQMKIQASPTERQERKGTQQCWPDNLRQAIAGGAVLKFYNGDYVAAVLLPTKNNSDDSGCIYALLPRSKTPL